MQKGSGASSGLLGSSANKVDLLANKRVLESLIKAGAMDSSGGRAGRCPPRWTRRSSARRSRRRDAAAGQSGLFGSIFDAEDAPAAKREAETLPPAPDWDEHTRLQNEKEVLGFFVSGHPLDKYREKLRNLNVIDTATAIEMKPEPQNYRRGQNEQPNEIQIAGVISGLKVAKSKRSGEMYAQATLEDAAGKIELIAFSTAYQKLAERLKIDVPVLVRGVLRGEEDSAPKLAVSNIQALEDVMVKAAGVAADPGPAGPSRRRAAGKAAGHFVAAPGPGKLLLDLEEPGQFRAVLEPRQCERRRRPPVYRPRGGAVGAGAVRVID